MSRTTPDVTGPNLEKYVETRFNLLNDHIKLADDLLRSQIMHLQELFALTQDLTKRAMDKAEAAQAAHNVAANEWRATVTDLKDSSASRQEFDLFYTEFGAYRLEAARLSSLAAGAVGAKKEGREATLAQLGLVATGISLIIGFAMPLVLRALSN